MVPVQLTQTYPKTAPRTGPLTHLFDNPAFGPGLYRLCGIGLFKDFMAPTLPRNTYAIYKYETFKLVYYYTTLYKTYSYGFVRLPYIERGRLVVDLLSCPRRNTM